MKWTKSKILRRCQSKHMPQFSGTLPTRYEKHPPSQKSWQLLQPHGQILFQIAICGWLLWIPKPLHMHIVIYKRSGTQQCIQQLQSAGRVANQYQTMIFQMSSNACTRLRKTNTCPTLPCRTDCQNSTHVLQFPRKCKSASQLQHLYQQQCHAKRKSDNITAIRGIQKNGTEGKKPQ